MIRGPSKVDSIKRVWRLVKSELAATSVIRLAKSSDRFAKSTRPERARASSRDDGRRLSSRCESVSAVRSSAKTNKTGSGFLVLSFPLFRPFKVCSPPAETDELRARREAL